jgi:leucyl-tRNA synthetase
MSLGQASKTLNTAGISGVLILEKLWRLYFDDNGLIAPMTHQQKENLKSLHKTIKKEAGRY